MTTNHDTTYARLREAFGFEMESAFLRQTVEGDSRGGFTAWWAEAYRDSAPEEDTCIAAVFEDLRDGHLPVRCGSRRASTIWP